MFKNRKIKLSKLSVKALFLIGVIFLNGCGENVQPTQNVTTTSDKTELTMWHYYSGSTKDMLDDLIKEFNETDGAKNNISLTAKSHSSVSELSSALVSSANKEVGVDDMPDIFAAYSDTALLLNDMGFVASLDSYFKDDELALFREDFLNEGRFDSEGNLKMLPVAKSTELLFVNYTDFKTFSDETDVKIEQLQTWEGLAEVAEIYYNWTDEQTETLNDGRALFGIDSEANLILITSKQTGGEFYDYSDDGVSFGLTEDEARKIWDNYMIPYIKGHYVSFGSFRSDDIKSGDLLMYSGSTSSVSYFPETVELGRTEAYDIKGIALPFPYFEGGEKMAIQQGAGMVVSKSDATREAAAAEFLKWFTASEHNLEFAVSSSYIPVQNKSLDFNSVLEVMKGETSNVILSSAEVTYNSVMPEYEFYASKPFDGSYDSRNAIKSHILDSLETAKNDLNARLDSGEDRDLVISDLTGDGSFKEWYLQFEAVINDILTKN